MSLDFKLHYDRLRQGDPTKPDDTIGPSTEGTYYDSPSHTRNLCLVWLDGKQQFLNYAYLVSGTFTPGEKLNEVILNFSTHTVTLKGYSLKLLFENILMHIPRQILQDDSRYIASADSQESIIIEIIVKNCV